MKRAFSNFLLQTILMINFSCAGTHGSIGGYSYKNSKEEVERAIRKLFLIEPGLRVPKTYDLWQSPSPFYSFYLGHLNPPLIFQVRFYGDEEFWRSNREFSHYFIIYVKRGEADAKSEQNMTKEEREIYTRIFEKEIKSKIDSVLMNK